EAGRCVQGMIPKALLAAAEAQRVEDPREAADELVEVAAVDEAGRIAREPGEGQRIVEAGPHIVEADGGFPAPALDAERLVKERGPAAGLQRQAQIIGGE